MRRHWHRVVICSVVVASLLGCEAVERKFTRNSKPRPRPSPIFSFEDYSHATTPLDRYRKHYALFEYWNAELIDAFGSPSPNPKRLTKSSSESLQELIELQKLLQDGAVPELSAQLDRRAQLDQELQSGRYHPSQFTTMRRDVEAQTRELYRVLHPHDVQDRLKVTVAAPIAPAPVAGTEADAGGH